MKTVFIKYYAPEEISDLTLDEVDDKFLLKYCFRVFKCKDEFHALCAYSETPCTWSSLFEDTMSQEDVEKWMKEAITHIRNRDMDWLEENFT